MLFDGSNLTTGQAATTPPAPSAPPEIEVRELRHSFEKDGELVEVLGGISFSVAQGEFVTIIGPSGCGKSTLLFLIAGFLRPTSGLVLHAGRPVEGPHPDRGTVFQADAVFPWLTVQKNVEFGPRVGGKSRAECRQIADRYLALVHLSDSARLYPKQLSGGMRKRVDIARAFANQPSTLLMDESFTSLDVQAKQSLQMALLTLWEQDKKTALFVTHDIEEAIFLADRVLVMRADPGVIVAEHRVPFGRPRGADLRMSPELQAMRHDLSMLLRQVTTDE